MKINPPLQEEVGQGWTQGWRAFFTQLFQAVGWLKSWSYRFELDFPTVSANSQEALTVEIMGVRQGDAVMVSPYEDVEGLIFKGVVTADDTVTVYAKNFSGPPVDPPLMFYRVTVLQN